MEPTIILMLNKQKVIMKVSCNKNTNKVRYFQEKHSLFI